jgi:hypothetical protein
MDKKVKQELSEMKYLFGYERGRVISEQKEIPVEEDMDTVGVIDNIDFDEDEIITMSGREVETPVRPDVDTPTKPKKPGTPYSPKPGPKKNPKAEDEVADVDMPNWLSFDELGLNFED